MKIRRIRRKDLRELAKLYAKMLRKSEKRAFFTFKFFMDHGVPGASLAAEENGKPIGAVFGVEEKTFTPDAAKIQSLFLAKEWRGKGIGKQLMKRCVAAMKKRGIKSISLLVDRKNTVAKGLYKGLGFRYFRTMLIKEF